MRHHKGPSQTECASADSPPPPRYTEEFCLPWASIVPRPAHGLPCEAPNPVLRINYADPAVSHKGICPACANRVVWVYAERGSEGEGTGRREERTGAEIHRKPAWGEAASSGLCPTGLASDVRCTFTADAACAVESAGPQATPSQPQLFASALWG